MTIEAWKLSFKSKNLYYLLLLLLKTKDFLINPCFVLKKYVFLRQHLNER